MNRALACGFKAFIYHSLVVQLWARCSSRLSLNFLICEMGIIILSALENDMNNTYIRLSV